MTLRITRPGLYVNRLGEKVEILRKELDRWIGHTHWYTDSGKLFVHKEDEEDLVDVWKEPKLTETVITGSTTHSDGRRTYDTKEQSVTYDLTKVSERFRALEDGRSLRLANDRYTLGIINLENKHSAAQSLQSENLEWSFVPETKRVVTKLWVYEHGDKYKVARSENGKNLNEAGGWWYVLGAIEGSEQISWKVRMDFSTNQLILTNEETEV